MGSQIERKLDRILNELAILRERQDQWISQQENHENPDPRPEGTGAGNFIAPDASGVNQTRAVSKYLAKFKAEGGMVPNTLSRILNPYQIEAGDVILIRPKSPHELGVFGRIKWSQTIDLQRRLVGDEEHASFTHATVSGKYHQIYESIPENGVIRTGYWRYMSDNYEVKVRRLKQQDQTKRSKILSNIDSLFRQRFDFLELAAIKQSSNDQDWLNRAASSISRDDTHICSALFAASCEREQVDLSPGFGEGEGSVITPAHLSASEALEDVKVDWVNIS